MAPSRARWSQDRPRIVIGRMAIASSTTTGRLTIASRSRIATCGWLITGVAMIEPYWPGLVIVNVPPATSSGRSSRLRARRARAGELTADEVRGGTFTITNPGGAGSILATPVINQPQVAILDTEAVVKRPVVVTDESGGDSIAIRQMTYLCMSWDHRALDGITAARFLRGLADRLEAWPVD